MSERGEDSAPQVFAIRIDPAVSAWIEQEYAAQAGRVGWEAAASWEGGLLRALASLATYPERCAVADEDVLFPGGTVRLLLYPILGGSRRRGLSWRVLFTVHSGGDDAAFVYVRLVRAGAQAPLGEWPASPE